MKLTRFIIFIGFLIILIPNFSAVKVGVNGTIGLDLIPEEPTFNNDTGEVNISQYAEVWETNVGDLDDANATQFDSGDGSTLNIIQSWITGLFYNWFNQQLNTTSNVTFGNIGSKNFTDIGGLSSYPHDDGNTEATGMQIPVPSGANKRTWGFNLVGADNVRYGTAFELVSAFEGRVGWGNFSDQTLWTITSGTRRGDVRGGGLDKHFYFDYSEGEFQIQNGADKVTLTTEGKIFFDNETTGASDLCYHQPVSPGPINIRPCASGDQYKGNYTAFTIADFDTYINDPNWDPYTYDHIDTGKRMIGLVAQNVSRVCPECVDSRLVFNESSQGYDTVAVDIHEGHTALAIQVLYTRWQVEQITTIKTELCGFAQFSWC